MKINQTTPTIEIVEPKELTKFQVAKLSGKSEYLRGIPAKPKKCWGKKVRLTPTKVIQKCIFP